MKRFFAFALAVMLCFSLAAVSFALNDIGYVTKVLNIPLAVNDENRIVASTNRFYSGGVPYGATVYYPLIGALKDSASGTKIDDWDNQSIDYWVTNADLTKSASLKKSWEEGSSAIKSVTIEKRKIEWDASGEYSDDKIMQQIVGSKDSYNNRYYYFVAVTLNDKASTSSTDVFGTVTLRKTGTNGFWGKGLKSNTSIDLEIGLSIGYPFADDTMVTDSLLIYNFSDSGSSALGTNDEENLTLYGDAGYFVVNTKGQGKTLISCNLEYNSTVSTKFPRADLSFINCNGATFKRTGELYLYADAGTHLYKVNSNGTVAKVNAKYNSDEGAFQLRTNTLESYVISDITLSTSASASNNEDEDEEDEEDNSSSSSSGDIIVIDPTLTPPTTSGGGSTVIPVNPGTGARL